MLGLTFRVSARQLRSVRSHNPRSLSTSTVTGSTFLDLAPVVAMQEVIEAVHITTNLPFWGSICATAVAVRMCLLPAVVVSMRHTHRLHRLLPSLTQAHRLSSGLSFAMRQRVHGRVLWELMRSRDVSLLGCLASPLIHIPVLVSASLAVRRLVTVLPLELSEGGIPGLLPDLTAVSPNPLLPALHVGIVLFNIQMSIGRGGGPFTPIDYILRGIQVLLLCSLPVIIHTVPVGVLLYWLTSGLWTSGQIFAFSRPAVRKLLVPESGERVSAPPAQMGHQDEGVSRLVAQQLQAQAERDIEHARTVVAERYRGRAASLELVGEVNACLEHERVEGRIEARLAAVLFDRGDKGAAVGVVTAAQAQQMMTARVVQELQQIRDQEAAVADGVWREVWEQCTDAAERVSRVNSRYQAMYESGELQHRYLVQRVLETGPVVEATEINRASHAAKLVAELNRASGKSVPE